jgi:hypothetical protein
VARRRWVAPVLFGLVPLTLLLALGVGAVAAWVRFAWQEQPAPAAGAPGDKAPDRDALLSAEKQEQALLALAEPYLSREKASANPATGFTLLMELGLFYLQQDRLDDALALFTKLDEMRQPESYHILGRVGRGVVLALHDQAAESNRLFKDAFTAQRFLVPDGATKGGKRGQRGEPQLLLVQNAQMKYWLAQAVHYNERNGIARAEMPPLLLRFADPAAPRPKP